MTDRSSLLELDSSGQMYGHTFYSDSFGPTEDKVAAIGWQAQQFIDGLAHPICWCAGCMVGAGADECLPISF